MFLRTCSYNHIILTGRKEGWGGSEGKRCLLFLAPVTPVTLATRGGFTKELGWTLSGVCDLQRRPNIIPHFPGFCCALASLIILFPEITTASGSHSCDQRELCERWGGRGEWLQGRDCSKGVSHGKWINAVGRTGSCHWGRSWEVSVFSGKWLCRVQFVSESSGSRE